MLRWLGAAIVLMPVAAQAQIPVTDALGNFWHAIEGGQLIQQVQQAIKTVDTLQQTYQNAQQQLRAVTGMVNVSAWAPNLNTSFLTNPLPGANQVMGLVNGRGLNGNALTGLANTFLQQNKAYLPAPANGDDNANWLNQRANSTAGFQAAAAQLLDSNSQRLAELDTLRAELDQQPDLEHLAAIQGRIAAEQTAAVTQGNQTAQLVALATAQRDAEQQQQEQRDRQSADSWFNHTQALP